MRTVNFVTGCASPLVNSALYFPPNWAVFSVSVNQHLKHGFLQREHVNNTHSKNAVHSKRQRSEERSNCVLFLTDFGILTASLP